MSIWQERRHVISYKAKFERVGPGKSFDKKTTPGDLFRRLTSTQNLNVLNPLMFYWNNNEWFRFPQKWPINLWYPANPRWHINFSCYKCSSQQLHKTHGQPFKHMEPTFYCKVYTAKSMLYNKVNYLLERDWLKITRKQ